MRMANAAVLGVQLHSRNNLFSMTSSTSTACYIETQRDFLPSSSTVPKTMTMSPQKNNAESQQLYSMFSPVKCRTEQGKSSHHLTTENITVRGGAHTANLLLPVKSYSTTKKTTKKGRELTSSKRRASKTSTNGIKKIKGKDDKQKRQTFMSEHFVVRKSSRKCATETKKEEVMAIQNRIRNRLEEGLKETIDDVKGRGVRAAQYFEKGDFVVEYYGDLIDQKEAARREKYYALDPKFGCYMYYFIHNFTRWCVDATIVDGCLGRLINHSKCKPNLITKLVDVDGKPHLCFFARQPIHVGDELLYDYGDRSKESLEGHPWLSR